MDAAPPVAIVSALKPCGLNANDITVRFDDEIQSTIVTVKSSVKVDASSFICLRQALWAKADIDFEDDHPRKSYRKFDDEISRAEGRAVARAWFEQRGLLDKLPSFTDGDSASSVTAKVEYFCGLKPGFAFEERFPGLLSIKRELMTVPPKPGLECLFYAMAAIDTDKVGMRFGFIGNEAVSEETEN
jgi:hypothetical protein